MKRAFNKLTTAQLISLLLVILCQIMIGSARADNNAQTSIKDVPGNELATPPEEESIDNLDTTKELEKLEVSLQDKTRLLKELKSKLRRSGGNPELEAIIQNTSQDLEILKKSFEQVAIGSIDLNVFDAEEQTQGWQNELAVVMQPLLENLRSLTEKPRKQENLRRIIRTQRNAITAADRALISIDELLTGQNSKGFEKELAEVKKKWLRLRNEAQSKVQLALYQLESLKGENVHWYQSFGKSVKAFSLNRGLTLLLALFVSLVIWAMFYVLHRLIERWRKRKGKYVNRTTYRVIAYAQKLLTILLVMVGILVVFFLRGDILLLAIMAILLFTAALGLRNLLPKFINESRLLLNIGSVRENEKVMYNGIPWRVASINVFDGAILSARRKAGHR